MDKFQLFYVHKVGYNFSDEFIYQLLFTNKIEEIRDIDWDEIICDSIPNLPKQYVDTFIQIESKIEFELGIDSVMFNMYDIIDGVIPIAWQKNNTDDNMKKRLHFRFEENYLSVRNKLEEENIKIIT